MALSGLVTRTLVSWEDVLDLVGLDLTRDKDKQVFSMIKVTVMVWACDARDTDEEQMELANGISRIQAATEQACGYSEATMCVSISTMSEELFSKEVVRIWAVSCPETKRIYAKGHASNGPIGENWVIRSMLWLESSAVASPPDRSRRQNGVKRS